MKIGNSFGGELAAAGLSGIVATWGDDGSITYLPGTTPEQIAAVEAVLTAHDPVASALLAAKQYASALISTHCGTTIVAGFASSALGSEHHYTATLEDQSNLTSLVLLGVDDYYTCTDAAGVKSARMHTLAQLKQVLADGGVEKKKHLSRARALKEQIAAAADIAAVEAIVW